MTNQTHHFRRSDRPTCAEPYEYKECGLQGIFLHSGFEYETHDGEKYVSVYDTEGLHRAIGFHLVQNRKVIGPEELRFLRKVLDMTQSELARLIGQNPQQIARWEKGQNSISGPADRLVRALFLLQNMGPDERENFIQLCGEIDEMDDLTPRRIMLYLNEGHWQDKRAA